FPARAPSGLRVPVVHVRAGGRGHFFRDAQKTVRGTKLMEIRNRRRLQLLVVAALFAAPAIIGIILLLAGWMPGTKSYGLPVLPERDLGQATVRLADGAPFAWRTKPFRWTLVALPGPDCARRGGAARAGRPAPARVRFAGGGAGDARRHRVDALSAGLRSRRLEEGSAEGGAMNTRASSVLRALAWIACAFAFCVIVFGAFVRLSNAGLSCPDWPT